MLAKRIIPCLDIKDGRTVKGTNFLQLRDAGDPVELAMRYCTEGADELVFLDITATVDKRKTLAELVRKIATHINIPFTVGGGINTIDDVSVLMEHGADKISVNTSAVRDPQLVSDLAKNFGSQCVVVAIDIKLFNGTWKVVTHGGRNATDLEATDWAKKSYRPWRRRDPFNINGKRWHQKRICPGYYPPDQRGIAGSGNRLRRRRHPGAF